MKHTLVNLLKQVNKKLLLSYSDNKVFKNFFFKETNPSISKKQMIVKELAVNILELNGYRTRTEQLDNELKNYNKLKTENNSTSKDYNLVSEKTEVNNLYINYFYF